jgi:hypothetical protein
LPRPPFRSRDRAAGYRYDISIRQPEFLLAAVLTDMTGHRTHLLRAGDLGEPRYWPAEPGQVIFDRKQTTAQPEYGLPFESAQEGDLRLRLT